MLSLLSKRREEKIRLKVEKLMEDGLNKVAHRLYNQGMIDFNNALALNQNLVSKILEENFNKFYEVGDWESATSIGSVIMKFEQNNHVIANKLGNCSRRTEDYKQANNLYRIALRSNSKYKEAFYNLAASMGKVNKYDLNVKETIDKYINFTEYIFPDYMDSPDYVKNIEDELIRDNGGSGAGEADQMSEVEVEVADEVSNADGKKHGYVPSFDEIAFKFDQIIEYLSQAEQTDKNIRDHQVAVFNACTHALINEDTELAQKRFDELSGVGTKFKYYGMLKALLLARQEFLAEAVDEIIHLLGKDRYNRYLNINLGLIYVNSGNKLLATKYLAIGASLLEKSEGLYRITEVFKMAIEYFNKNSNRKSLTLFKIVVSEQDDVLAWQYIGDICFRMNNMQGAIKAYQKIVSIDPQSDIGEKKLKTVHDFFYKKGLANFEGGKSRLAADYFKKALNVVEVADTFEKAIKLYLKIKEFEEVQELQKRYDVLKKKEKDSMLDQQHQELKKRAQKYLKVNKFEKAIECYEKAFAMKIDKDVFMYLAYIYKRMKNKDKLNGLMKRWEKMLDDEEKRQQRERSEARSKKAYS